MRLDGQRGAFLLLAAMTSGGTSGRHIRSLAFAAASAGSEGVDNGSTNMDKAIEALQQALESVSTGDGSADSESKPNTHHGAVIAVFAVVGALLLVAAVVMVVSRLLRRKAELRDTLGTPPAGEQHSHFGASRR